MSREAPPYLRGANGGRLSSNCSVIIFLAIPPPHSTITTTTIIIPNKCKINITKPPQSVRYRSPCSSRLVDYRIQMTGKIILDVVRYQPVVEY